MCSSDLLFDDLLNAFDGVALCVEKVFQPAQELKIVRAIVPAPTAAFERLDLRKARFPKAENVLGKSEIFGCFGYCAERIRRFINHL